MLERSCLVLCFLAILLGCRHAGVEPARTEIDPVAEGCKRWHKDHLFEDLRSCYLSIAHIGEHKTNVVAMLGPGQRVTVSHKIWSPPREAFSYTAVDRPDFHYVAVYEREIMVEQCGYELGTDGQVLVVVP